MFGRLNSLSSQLEELDGAYLEIRPERLPEFEEVKRMMGQNLYEKILS